MKKSLSLFLTLTMAMVLSVSAPSVVCAGRVTPKAVIEQGEIKPEKIYLKSTDLPAFAVGNMKAADEAARAKYKHDDQGRPVFHELNAKTHFWMNSENIKGVDGFKSDYEIAQEALALQKKKLKKPYQDKINEQVNKYKEKLAAHEALKKKLADLERQAGGSFTDEEKEAFCAEKNNPEGCPTKDDLQEMKKNAKSELDKNKENLKAQIKDSEEQLKKDAEEANKIIAENQEKINEIDAAKNAEALGKVKAKQDQDVAKKREEAAAAKKAVEEAEDRLNEICPDEGSGVKTTCEQKHALEIVAAEDELEKARSKAATAEADADAAEQKIVDDLKNENETIKNTLYEHDRFGETETINNEDKRMKEKVDEAVEKEMNSAKAMVAIDDQAKKELEDDLEYKNVNNQIDATVSKCRENNKRASYSFCNHENIAARDDKFKGLVTRRDEIYENARKGAENDYRNSITKSYTTELKKDNDLAKEVIASSTSTADVTGVSFNKPKDNKRPVPTGEGVGDIFSGNQS